MKPNPIGWFEIYVQDMPRAKKFYETVFATKLDRVPMEGPIELWSFPMQSGLQGAPGALVKMEGFDGGGTGTIVYFSSEDCAIETARVVAAGGEVQKPRTSIGAYGFISLVVDTEGNLIGIHSRK